MSHTLTKALQNEVQALKQLARFSWLTSQQIGLLIWPHSTNANQMSNRTLKRLLDKELIMSEPLNAKHFSARYRAYYLSPLGKMYLEAQFPDVKIYGFFGAGRKNDEGELYFLMSEKEHYHRFITNQFIIELELFDLFDIWVGDKEVFNENRLLAHKRRFKNMLGAVPDLILNSKSPFQKTIIDACELVDHQFAAHRVESGTRKYKYSDRRMIEILEEYRDSDITMRELCEKNNIHSANVYRWNKRFNVFEASANKAKSWGIK